MLRQAPRLGDLTRTRMLAPRGSVDDEDARGRRGILLPLKGLRDPFARLEPLGGQAECRIRELGTRRHDARPLAIDVIAVPRFLENPLELGGHRLERRIVETRVEASAELLLRNRDERILSPNLGLRHAVPRRVYGASVGWPIATSRSLSPEDTNTSFVAVTITPSTCGRRSMSAIPSAGPRMNTPVDSPSACVGLSATMVTLRQPRAGWPVAGSIMW